MLASIDHVIVALRDGRMATIRSVDKEDAEPIQRFIRGLSPRSRYQRFLASLAELNAQMLERILSPRGDREITLVAEAGPRIVALAQFASVEHEHSGEVAVVVAEDWRRSGLGTQLLRAVAAQALNIGFRHGYADILRDNTAAIGLARRFRVELGGSPNGAILMRATGTLELP